MFRGRREGGAFLRNEAPRSAPQRKWSKRGVLITWSRHAEPLLRDFSLFRKRMLTSSGWNLSQSLETHGVTMLSSENAGFTPGSATSGLICHPLCSKGWSRGWQRATRPSPSRTRVRVLGSRHVRLRSRERGRWGGVASLSSSLPGQSRWYSALPPPQRSTSVLHSPLLKKGELHRIHGKFTVSGDTGSRCWPGSSVRSRWGFLFLTHNVVDATLALIF